MKTTIKIDTQLIAEALRLTGAKTKREVVDLALRTLVELRKADDVRRFRGKLQWEGDLDKMRRDN